MEGNHKKENTSGGLYKNVNISIKSANIIVAVGCIFLVLVMLILINNNGFIVSFDTNGGTEVESIKAMHGDYLNNITPPTKEGYNFTGWYYDADCTQKWDTNRDTVSDSITLYAGWEKKDR